jgi:HAD superfamily hydrolase (TIGR01509 family)
VNEKRGAALFDIDGTLVDSNYLHVSAWLRAFHEAGFAVDAWRLHRAIGMGSSQLLSTLIGEQSAERAGDRIKKRHSELYGDSADLLRVFDQARELVKAVAALGVTVVLATSAAPDELDRLRELLDLDDTVADIVAGADVDAAKPEPDLVEVALDKAGATAGRAVFVGDAVWDIKAAKRASVRSIGVLSGGTSAAELSEAGAATIYDDVAALLRDLDLGRSPLSGL